MPQKKKKIKRRKPFSFTEKEEWRVRKLHGQTLVFAKCENGPALVTFDNRNNALKFLNDLDKRGIEWVVSPPEVLLHRETATIKAALWFWREMVLEKGGAALARRKMPVFFEDADPLSLEELSRLCERYHSGFSK